ncbi:hypothetical protein BDN72DRAFT_901222 [Pluteus cervinus]|uniref:Uncharacterized protein n=1 Tax=Pluteus cervinus TaxID=181527 RepID=A0ACD3AH11_9AGAR|nr:hypothetical protein BDN72DRAFT_901222 [Pluteus cervinus]
MSSPTGIHHLPTEILEKILSVSDLTYECYDLALLSRRLNSLAIPRFLAVRGASDPAKVFSIALNNNPKNIPPNAKYPFWKSRDSLAGLAIFFDIQSIDELTCSLFPYLRLEITAYERLFRILGRLKQIRRVTLLFLTVGQSTTMQSSSGRLGDSLWADVLGRLLNLFIEKGCENFTLRNKIFSWEYIPEKGSPGATISTTLLLKFRTLASVGHGGSDAHIIPDSFNSGCGLKPFFLSTLAHQELKMVHLSITGITLLRRPYLSWTYSVLGSPSLTSLNLSGIFLWAEMWEAAFNWFLTPLQSKLLKLTIHDCRAIPSGPLFKFLVNLKSLTHLSFSYSFTPGDYEKTLPSPPASVFRKQTILPNLVWLRTYPEWINLLIPKISLRTQPQTLIVLPDRYNEYMREGFASFIQKIDLILLSPAPPKPDLKLTSTSKSDTPAVPEQRIQDPETRIHITIDTSALFDFDSAAFNNDFQHHKRYALMRPKIDARVTGVIFRAETVSLFSQEGVSRLCTFVGWWKNFRTVELVSEHWSLVWNSPDAIFQRLAAEAKSSCPYVKRFILAGNIYEIDQGVRR